MKVIPIRNICVSLRHILYRLFGYRLWEGRSWPRALSGEFVEGWRAFAWVCQNDGPWHPSQVKRIERQEAWLVAKTWRPMNWKSGDSWREWGLRSGNWSPEYGAKWDAQNQGCSRRGYSLRSRVDHVAAAAAAKSLQSWEWANDKNPAFWRQREGRPAPWLRSQTPWQEASLLRLFSTRNQGAHLCLRTRIITTSWGQRWLNWKYPSFMELWPSRRSSRGNRQVVYEQVSRRCAQPESTTGTAGARDLTQGVKCPLVGFSATLPTHYSPGPPAPSHLGSGLRPGAPSGGFSYLHTWCPPDEKWSCCSKHFQRNPLPAGETEPLIWGRWGLPLVLSPLIQLFGILAGWAELWGQGGIWGDSLAVLCTNCLGSPVSSRKTRSEAFWQLPGKRPSWQYLVISSWNGQSHC